MKPRIIKYKDAFGRIMEEKKIETTQERREGLVRIKNYFNERKWLKYLLISSAIIIYVYLCLKLVSLFPYTDICKLETFPDNWLKAQQCK